MFCTRPCLSVTVMGSVRGLSATVMLLCAGMVSPMLMLVSAVSA
ncbi:hypothetical protein PIS_031 [Saccharomonospora phage PIS 136]|nr:hypothetical protein PIS_031 [Saccharomonospora phage PIS 136]